MRNVGGGMSGEENGFKAGIWRSSGLRSPFPIASLIASKSNPAFDGSGVSNSSVPGGVSEPSAFGGEGGVDRCSVRAGRSSSALASLFDEVGGVFLAKEETVGGRDTFCGVEGAFFFRENQPFLAGKSSSSRTTIRSSVKSGSCG